MNKLYFENKNSTYCYPLKHFLDKAKLEYKYTVTLVEAVPISELTWCDYYECLTVLSECTSTHCKFYEKSRDGSCISTNIECRCGNSVTFDVDTGEII